MTKPIGYFVSDDYAIEKFASNFQKEDNTLALSDNDQAALCAVLAQHAWGCNSGLEDDFWTNVDHAIGDGAETSMETEEDDAPLNVALDILQVIKPESCYGLIAYLVQ